MLIAAHYALYQKHNTTATFSNCYWYSTSISNQRIKAQQSQLTKGSTQKQRVKLSPLFSYKLIVSLRYLQDYFSRLNQDGLFIKNQLADHISIIAVYMPLLRREIYKFIRLQNIHDIQKQKERPDGVYGKPYFLYFHPEDHGIEDYSLTANKNLVNKLLDDIDGQGIVSQPF